MRPWLGHIYVRIKCGTVLHVRYCHMGGINLHLRGITCRIMRIGGITYCIALIREFECAMYALLAGGKYQILDNYAHMRYNPDSDDIE